MLTKEITAFGLLFFLANSTIAQEVAEDPNERMAIVVAGIIKANRKATFLELFSEESVARIGGQASGWTSHLFTLSETDRQHTGIDRIQYSQFDKTTRTTIYPAQGKSDSVDMATIISKLGLSPRLEEQLAALIPHGPTPDGVTWLKDSYGYQGDFGMRATMTNKSTPCLSSFEIIENH